MLAYPQYTIRTRTGHYLHILALGGQHLQEVGQRVLLLQDEVVGRVGTEHIEDAVDDALAQVAGGGAEEGVVEDAKGIDVLHAGSWGGGETVRETER